MMVVHGAQEEPNTEDSLKPRIPSSQRLESKDLGAGLSHDVIYHLLGFLDRSDLLAFMTTCRALRETGVRHLLALKTPLKKPGSFLAFLHADVARSGHLFHLHFALQVALPSSLDGMQSILSLANSLQTLKITRNFDLIEPAQKISFFSALSHLLPCLRQLKIRLTGTSHADDRAILAGLAIPTLSTLDISFRSRHADPLPLLPWSELSDVTTLVLGGVLLEAQDLELPSMLHFPNILNLSIHDTGMQDLTALVQRFPRVRTLRLRTDGSGMSPAYDKDELSVLRSANLQSQQEGLMWTELDILSGDLLTLYVYALAVPTRTLRIESELVTRHHAKALNVVLEDTHPTSLSLCFAHSNKGGLSTELIRKAIPSSLRLTRLALRIKLWPQEEVKGPRTSLLNSILDALTGMPLSSMRLEVDLRKWLEPLPCQCPQGTASCEMNAECLSRRLISRLPTLEHVTVGCWRAWYHGGLSTRRWRYWHITNGVAREEAPDAGEAVMDTVGLTETWQIS